MMNAKRLAPVAIVVAVASGPGAAAFPCTAHAQESAGADTSQVSLSEQRAAEAFQAYSKKDYAGAVALYLQAYDAAPSGSILYNVARIYDTKLGDRPLAITYYRRYIADPGAYVERIAFANERLKQLREAETLSQELEDAEPPSKQTPPSEARTNAVTEPHAPPLAPDATESARGWSAMRYTGVVFGGAGLLALGTGAAFGLRAMAKANTAQQVCDGNACSSQRGVDAANSAKDAATAADIGLIAGAGLLAVGTALFVLGGRHSREASPAALRFDTRASRSALALEVSGQW
jgi:hypothetical protein